MGKWMFGETDINGKMGYVYVAERERRDRQRNAAMKRHACTREEERNERHTRAQTTRTHAPHECMTHTHMCALVHTNTTHAHTHTHTHTERDREGGERERERA